MIILSVNIRQNQQGFTLVELIFVLVLLGILSFILYGILEGIVQTKKYVELNGRADRTARYVIERLSKEVSSRTNQPLNTVNPSEEGSPQVGRLSRQYFASTNEREGDVDTDTLRFVSAAGAQAVFGAVGNAGMVELYYRLEPDPEKQENNDEDNIKTYLLIREEMPVGVSNLEALKTRRIIFPLAENILGLNFRFLRNGTWQDTWELSGRYPEAIEITLKVKTDREKPATYRTAITIKPRVGQSVSGISQFPGLQSQ